MKQIVFIFLLLFCFVTFNYGQTFQNKEHDFYIDVLSDWEIVSGEGDMFEAVSPNKDLAVMVAAEINKQSKLAQEKLYNNFYNDYNPSNVESEAFIYNGNNARMGFGDFISEGNGLEYRAYVLLIQKDNKNYWLTLIGQKVTVEENLAQIFSIIDSLSIGKEGLLQSGPVSQLDYQKSSSLVSTEINFNNHKFAYLYDIEEFNVAQRVVEREMLVMQQYAHNLNEMAYIAWVRYYRMIYRDNFGRYAKLYEAIKNNLSNDKTKAAEELLRYTQDYEYVRGMTNSDLNAPYKAIISKQGDCDSMSLSYIILLNYHKISSALLLSQKLRHAITGVAVNKPDDGANVIDIFGSDYVIAELTTKDKLGYSVDKVLQNNDWFPILFAGKE